MKIDKPGTVGKTVEPKVEATKKKPQKEEKKEKFEEDTEKSFLRDEE